MKHITATPFADFIVEPPMQLPDSILHYINSKLPSIHNIQVCKSNSEARILVFYLQSSRFMYFLLLRAHFILFQFSFSSKQQRIKLQSSSQKFWQTVLTNSIPTLQSYVDDVLSFLPSSSASKDEPQYQPSLVTALSGVHLGNVVSNVDSTRSLIPISAMQKHPHLDSFMYSTNFLDFPGPHSYPPSFDSENTQDLIDSIILKFSECVLIDEQINFAPTISIGSPSSTDLALLEVFSREQVNKNFDYTVSAPKEGI